VRSSSSDGVGGVDVKGPLHPFSTPFDMNACRHHPFATAGSYRDSTIVVGGGSSQGVGG